MLQVNQWLVAVKRIIQELRAKAAGSEVNQGEGQAQPNVIDPCLTVQEKTVLLPSPPVVKDGPLTESAEPTSSPSRDKDSDTPAEGGS